MGVLPVSPAWCRAYLAQKTVVSMLQGSVIEIDDWDPKLPMPGAFVTFGVRRCRCVPGTEVPPPRPMRRSPDGHETLAL